MFSIRLNLPEGSVGRAHLERNEKLRRDGLDDWHLHRARKAARQVLNDTISDPNPDPGIDQRLSAPTPTLTLPTHSPHQGEIGKTSRQDDVHQQTTHVFECLATRSEI